MFKLIFRTMVLIMVLIIAIVALAVWKGGESFRWIGGKTISAGKSIEKFGNFIDRLKEEKKKTEKTLERLKETINSKEDKEKRLKDQRWNH